MKNIVVISLLVTIASCSLFKKKQDVDKDVIARVNDEYLYASDIESLTRGLAAPDSITVLKTYADSWVRKKLLLQKAADNIEEDVTIARKVEDYRETLLLYEYEKALVNQKLDTTYRAAEVAEWYEKMKGVFPLKNDVYLIYFIKFKKDAPDLALARKWILHPKDDEALQKLRGYCKEFAVTYTLDEGMWYEKDNALKNFPIGEGDIHALTSSRQFREFKIGEDDWFIKIAEVLKKDEPSPLEFVKAEAQKAIVEKRRMQLIERIYNKVYQEGLQDKSFDIYVKE